MRGRIIQSRIGLDLGEPNGDSTVGGTGHDHPTQQIPGDIKDIPFIERSIQRLRGLGHPAMVPALRRATGCWDTGRLFSEAVAA